MEYLNSTTNTTITRQSEHRRWNKRLLNFGVIAMTRGAVNLTRADADWWHTGWSRPFFFKNLTHVIEMTLARPVMPYIPQPICVNTICSCVRWWILNMLNVIQSYWENTYRRMVWSTTSTRQTQQVTSFINGR